MNGSSARRCSVKQHPEPADPRALGPTTCLALALCLVLGPVYSCNRESTTSGTRPPGPLYQDLSSVAAASSIIAIGTVTSIAQGRTVTVGEDRLAFNDISLRVERLLKGKVSDPFIVEQVANVERVVTPGIGPAYRVGERYLLFLLPGEGLRLIPIPQGRYRIDSGVVTPLDGGPAADSMKGRSESQVLTQLESLTTK